MIYDDTGQKTCLNYFHSVWQQQASLQKLGPLKILIGSCTDLDVDSGSCSRLKCKLRPESTPALRLRDHLWSVVYTRPCSHHAYSTWACVDWLLDDRLPGQIAFLNIITWYAKLLFCDIDLLDWIFSQSLQYKWQILNQCIVLNAVLVCRLALLCRS